MTILLVLYLWTLPPSLPSYTEVRRGWRPSEAWLYARDGSLLDAERIDFDRRRLAWVPLRGIAPAAVAAITAAEDRRFAWHGGVDYWALAAALRDRLSGRAARGASTLTMQLAGFLAPSLAVPGHRGWRDKLRQMRAALAIEDRWTKPQILEAYLNLAGFRGEQQGIGAAAHALFARAPDALSRPDGVLLAALLPQPQADSAAVARRACALAGGGNCRALAAAAAEMLGPARRIAIDPGLAPHLARRLLAHTGDRVTSTIDPAIQRIATAALVRQLQGLGVDRARDGAVVVVANATGEVLAYVGGAGIASTAGAVDGADAYRQAGSTLKPFLYAQAIERGLVTPASIVDDSPVQLDTASGLYVPQNYDRGFKGPVSVRTALAASLNVPAVRTLLLDGVDDFRDRLWDLGYGGLTEDGGYYGFSLALGSAEVTLLQQAAAYRTLATGGRWSPLRLTPADAVVPPRQVMTPAAAWLTADMLADAAARATGFGLDSALRLPFWAAVKTGTSKAMRDNWCVGTSDRFTVAVWVGNLEGDAMRDVSGTAGAAPVWREVMLALHALSPGRPPPRPAGVEHRAIRFAGAIEPARREWFLAGTGQTLVAAAPALARRPRIADPVTGSIYALDPDIPPRRQRLRIRVAGPAAGLRLAIDGRDLGPAAAGPLLLAPPGAHRLVLADAAGRTLDSVRFTMR